MKNEEKKMCFVCLRASQYTVCNIPIHTHKESERSMHNLHSLYTLVSVIHTVQWLAVPKCHVYKRIETHSNPQRLKLILIDGDTNYTFCFVLF